MSGQCTIWAWKQAITNPTHRLVLLALADIARDTGKVWAGHPYIADKIGFSARTVRSSIAALEASGLIRTEPRPGKADITWLILTPVVIFPDGPEDEGADVKPRGRPKTPASGAQTPASGAATPEGRSAEPIKEPSNQPRPSSEGLPTRSADRSEARTVFDGYNELAERHGWPKAAKLHDSRRGHINARIRDANGLDGFMGFLASIPESDFLMGRTAGRRGAFVISLDFILQPVSFTRLMEGFYHRNRPNGSGSTPDSFDPTAARNDRRTSAMFTGARLASERRDARNV